MSALEKAKNELTTLSAKPGNDELLFLYAHYKQATAGDVQGARPGMMNIVGRFKYDAWANLKGMAQAEAETKYIDRVNSLLKADGK